MVARRAPRVGPSPRRPAAAELPPPGRGGGAQATSARTSPTSIPYISANSATLLPLAV